MTDTADTDGLAPYTTDAAPTPDADGGLPAFDDAAADAAVVGLGEASHGARTCFRAKHRLLRRLVTDHGCRVFALEASGPAVRALDAAASGERDPADALAELQIWPWKTAAVRDLLAWLRSYNREHPEDRVRVRGVDCQYTTGAVASIRRFCETHLGGVPTGLADDLAVGDDGGSPPSRDDDPGATAAAAARVAETVRGLLADTEAPSTAVDRVRADCRTLERAAAFRRPFARADDGLPDGVSEVRDRGMAAEVSRLAGDADGPVAFWAHDSHLDRRHRRPTTDDTDRSPSAGSVLVEEFGDDYVVVRFSLGGGAVTAVTGDGDDRRLDAVDLDGPVPGTAEAALARAVDGPALVDLRAAAAAGVGWATTERDHFAVGATFDGDPTERLTRLVPARAADLWWHLPETAATERLDAE
ncbi:erythromycin esterase family protein [Halobaculum sp. MBLA0143]|uniref:erythromycin esterase family protein n=1 Tax=Halobaculum sp. MBLA0143 TaxID=3079933 RepID=UPI003526A1B5